MCLQRPWIKDSVSIGPLADSLLIEADLPLLSLGVGWPRTQNSRSGTRRAAHYD